MEGIEIPEGVHPIGGQVRNFNADELFGKKEVRRMDQASHYALAAARQAIADSRLEITEDNAYDVGCVIGTGVGGVQTLAEATVLYTQRGKNGVQPTKVPAMLHDNISAKISMEYGLRGANYSVVTACATGNNAIGEGLDAIRLGRAKVMVVGASEAAMHPVVLSGFDNLTTLSHYEGDPAKAARPFDLNRDGFVIAEGAGVLVLEGLEYALERGATIYGEILGYGHTSDAYHVTAPREDGLNAARSVQLAMRDAGITAEEIDYINAHGTGTKLNDAAETLALKKALGERAYEIPVSSTKSMTGHMLSATPVIEAVLCMMAMRDNFIPPTINLETPDPDCDLDYVPNEGRQREVNVAVSTAFGFGGHNAVIVIRRYNGASV
jgi:3-oxoacyl-[acyl-carrier-protein] synthase II